MGNNHRVVSLNDNNLLADDKITIHTPVTVGSGGSSYIDSSLENSKINNKFNDTYGKVLLIKKRTITLLKKILKKKVHMQAIK